MGKRNELYGYWTKKENVIAEALKYEKRSDFNKNSSGAYRAAVNGGYLNEACIHMIGIEHKPKNYWNKERLFEEAIKYSSRGDFRKNSKNAYTYATNNGLLDEVCNHMPKRDLKPRGYWTKDLLIKEALKYDNKRDFKKGSQGAYSSATKQKLINKICGHMSILGNLSKRYLYKVTFEDGAIYIGLSWDPEKRFAEGHIISKSSSVYKYMIKTGLKPTLELMSGILYSAEDAAELEDLIIEEYKELGKVVLNKTKGGALGFGKVIWTPEKVWEEALKYNNRIDFKNNSRKAWSAASRLNIFKEVCAHMELFKKCKNSWTLEEAVSEVSKYKTSSEFYTGAKYLYKLFSDLGLLDEAYRQNGFPSRNVRKIKTP